MPLIHVTDLFSPLPGNVPFLLAPVPKMTSAQCWFNYKPDEFKLPSPNKAFQECWGIKQPDWDAPPGVDEYPQYLLKLLKRIASFAGNISGKKAGPWLIGLRRDEKTTSLCHVLASPCKRLQCIGLADEGQLVERMMCLYLLALSDALDTVDFNTLGFDRDYCLEEPPLATPFPWAAKFFIAENFQSLKKQIAAFLALSGRKKRLWAVCTRVHKDKFITSVFRKSGGKDDTYSDFLFAVEADGGKCLSTFPRFLAMLFWR